MSDTRKFGLVPMEIWRTTDNLELFQQMAAGELPAPRIAETLDFQVVEVERGRVVFSGEPKSNYYNPAGAVHGGYIGTLLDSAMSCAVQSTLAAGKAMTTLEFKVSFVRPVFEKTGIVLAEGIVLNAGKQIATAEGKLVDANGKLYAHATTTCMIFNL
jgi:uncharacterized protein (TIGR00369 family)